MLIFIVIFFASTLITVKITSRKLQITLRDTLFIADQTQLEPEVIHIVVASSAKEPSSNIDAVQITNILWKDK